MNALMRGAAALAAGWLVLTSALAAERPATTYETTAGIAYRTPPPEDEHGRARCRLDFYRPTNTPGFPTIVWFHAGGLTGGDRAVPAALQNAGVAVVAAGYRLSPHVKSPLYLEDAAAAVAWTIRHIGEHGGDPRRVFVAGHSAGGYLALMLGLDRRWLAAHQIEADALAGVVSLSGQAITHFTIRAERGGRREQPVIDDLAPLFHVRAGAPRLLLVTGDRERELLGRYEENAYLWRMLREAGHPRVELRELQGFDHGEMVEPGLLLLRRLAQETPTASR